MLKLCSNRAKAKLFFDACCLFFDLFHLFFDLFRFCVRFCSVWAGPKFACALTSVKIALTFSTNLGEDYHDLWPTYLPCNPGWWWPLAYLPPLQSWMIMTFGLLTSPASLDDHDLWHCFSGNLGWPWPLGPTYLPYKPGWPWPLAYLPPCKPGWPWPLTYLPPLHAWMTRTFGFSCRVSTLLSRLIRSSMTQARFLRKSVRHSSSVPWLMTVTTRQLLHLWFSSPRSHSLTSPIFCEKTANFVMILNWTQGVCSFRWNVHIFHLNVHKLGVQGPQNVKFE